MSIKINCVINCNLKKETNGNLEKEKKYISLTKLIVRNRYIM